MLKPEVSIIIPAFNVQNTIQETLDSLLAQTYQNFEVILVDDGSIDKSGEIIKDFLKKYPQKFKYIWQKNQGAAVARNVGLKQAQGKFIAWIDADDLWLPKRLELMLKEFRKNSHIAFVSTDACYLYSDGQVSKKTYYQIHGLPTKYSFKEMLRRNFIFGSPLISREVVKKVGFLDESLVRSEDYDYWLRILVKNYQLAIIKKPLALYRIRSDSLSQNFVKVNHAELKILVKIGKIRNFSSEEKEILNWHMKKVWLNLAQEYAKKNNFKQAIKYFKKNNNTWSKSSISLLSSKVGKKLWPKLMILKTAVGKIKK